MPEKKTKPKPKVKLKSKPKAPTPLVSRAGYMTYQRHTDTHVVVLSDDEVPEGATSIRADIFDA